MKPYRPLLLLLILSASLFLSTLLNEPQNTVAAEPGQKSPVNLSPLNSPLDSPVKSPSGLPTPTPTATSPLPPTATPPARLRKWPTPTPTPVPSRIAAAMRFLAADQGLSQDSLELYDEQFVDAPAPGDQLWLGRFLDRDSGQLFWVLVDQDGKATALPDWSKRALAVAADTHSVQVADLVLVAAEYRAYPFSRQLAWIGNILHAPSGKTLPVAIDLTGDAVDIDRLERAESAARRTFCGAVDPSLCRDLLMLPDSAERFVQIQATNRSAVSDIVDFLNEAGVTHRRTGAALFALLTKEQILAIGQMKNVKAVLPDFPQQTLPLESNIVLGLSEVGGEFILEMRTDKLYGTLNYQVVTDLVRKEVTTTKQISLEVHISGVLEPAMGPAAIGPATAQVDLGELSGTYTISFIYEQMVDRYRLSVSPYSAILRPVTNRFTWPRYTTWRRLPEDAVWFVVQAQTVDKRGRPIDVNPDAFQEKADAFYDDIEALGARPFVPRKGVYANQNFIPPWPDWQIPDRGFVQVPVSEDRAYLFTWPDIRYYHFDGALRELEAVIETHCVDEVLISGYTQAGDILEVCQP